MVPEEINNELAEFIGIHLGDGYLNLFNYEVSIVCGEIDKDYITNFIPTLIYHLFSKKAKISYSKIKKAIKCRIYSKEIADFLVNNYNLCSGKKINPRIPEVLFKDNLLLKKCVRGLIDTDGGVHKHHKKSIQLKFDSIHYSLISSLEKAFLQLGFNPRLSKNQKRDIYTLYLFGEQVEQYFKEIGSNNPKNNVKFNTWKEKGIAPLNREIVNTLFINR